MPAFRAAGSRRLTGFPSAPWPVRPNVTHGVTYLDSARHKLEVQHYRYRTAIKKLLKNFGPVTGMSYPPHTQSEAMETERATGGKRPLKAAE